MRLLQNFIKLSLIGNIRNYIRGIISVIITTIALNLCNNIIINIRQGNLNMLTDVKIHNYKYSSIILSICILCGIFVIVQYQKIMKTNVKDYCILKSLGAAGFHIKKLIGLQAVLLFILTVPLGLSIGIILSNDLLKVFHNVTYLEFSNHIPVTIILIFFLSGVISSTICIYGFIITVDLNQKRSSQISLD